MTMPIFTLPDTALL